MPAITIIDLSNAKLDVDHIAAISTSSATTTTDRLGNVKSTVYGAIQTLKAFNARGAWATATAYAIKDVYTYSGYAYVAVTAHTSTTVAADLASGYVTIHQGATREDLAASTGASVIGYMPPGGIATTVQKKLQITASDTEAVNLQSSPPCYAAVAVNLTRTTIDRHAFEDWSKLNTTDTGLGYCSFDAKATLTNSLDQNHFVGYQSRNIYSGSGNVQTYMHGYDTAMVHNGTGNLPFVAGVHLRDISGAGPVASNYGLYVDTISRGTTVNYGIFSGEGNNHNFGGLSGNTITGTIQTQGVNFAVDTAGKAIAYGFGQAGQTQFGRHDFYDGKNNLIATLGNSGISVTGPIKAGSYTNVSLPVGVDGQTAYASNGRKLAEGAGAGTGVPVYYSNGVWRRYYDDAVVTF